MSAYGMTPKFNDYHGYRQWRNQWRTLYKNISMNIRNMKYKTKELQKNNDPLASKYQHDLTIDRAIGRKLMMLLDEAKLLWLRIRKMNLDLDHQQQEFPLSLECPTIDFHFNKGHLRFPNLPMWVIKAKGKTYYVDHVESDMAWNTKEKPEDNSTKGLIRFKHCVLIIDEKRTAFIKKKIA